MSLRLPPDMHKAVKQIALDNDISVQSYLTDLIQKDLQKKKEQKKAQKEERN